MIDLFVVLLWWLGLIVSAGISVLVIVCLAAWLVEIVSEHARPDFDRDHAGRARLGLANDAPAVRQHPGA